MTTRTPPSTHGYRHRLCEQLEVAGPVAVEMLDGSAPVDATLVLAALESATLLTNDTAGGEHRVLRTQVVRSAERSAVPDRLVRGSLSGAVLAWPQGDPSLREAHLRELLALGGLRSVVSTSERWRVDRVLDDAVAGFELSPEDFADLSPYAVYLDDELDLPEAHVVSKLLDSLRLAEVLAAEPLSLAGLEAAFEAARTAVAERPAAAPGAWWGALAGLGQRVADFVRGAQASWDLALAADAGAGQAELPRDRVTVWTADGRGEVNLVAGDRVFQVEWFGDPGDTAPDTVLFGGVALQEQPSPLLGARLWALPDTRPAGGLVLELVFGDERVVVRTEEQHEAH